ncbi:MAG: HAD-IIIA family hydrolase [Aquiluna sp.]
MPNLLLLDRDGTLTQNKVRPGDYINDPSEIELIPGVLERLRGYRDAGWEMAILSNQGGIEKGLVSLDKVIAGMKTTMSLAGGMIEWAWFCPSAYPSRGETAFRVGCVDGFESWNCCQDFAEHGYRKPLPGMAMAALDWFRVTPTDQVVFVGDRPEDEAMASNAGLKFINAADWRTHDDSH